MKDTIHQKRLKQIQRYCSEDITEIDGFADASRDNFIGWCVHHKLETRTSRPLSRQRLLKLGRYWHVPASELIFMRAEEHCQLHNTGKHVSKATKKKMSQKKLGKRFSQQHKASISQKLKDHYESGRSAMLVEATRGSCTMYFATASEFGRFVGASRQAVSQVLSPDHPRFKTACGWSLRLVSSHEE